MQDSTETLEEFWARNFAVYLKKNEDEEMPAIFRTVTDFIKATPVLDALDGIEFKQAVAIFWRAYRRFVQ